MPSRSLSTQQRAALPGAGLIVLAATGFSSKSILIKLAYGDGAALDPITLMTLRMLFSLPFFLLAALWRPDTTAARMRRLDWGGILLLGLMLAAFTTVLPAFLMNAGIGRIGASQAAIISAAGPIATLVMAWWILGEPLTTVQIVGALLVLSGVLVISLKKEAEAGVIIGLRPAATLKRRGTSVAIVAKKLPWWMRPLAQSDGRRYR